MLAEAEGAAGRVMLDPIRRLLAEAGKAKQTRAFWQAATDILSEWAGGARVHLSYKGLNESGSIEAGTPGKDGETFLTDYHDAEGRHVSARFEGLPAGTPGDVLRSGVEIATHLAVMVARRSGLERERRLGTQRGAIPYLNLSFALLEQAVRRSRAGAVPAVEVPFFNLGGGQTVDGKVASMGNDSLSVAIGTVEFHLRVAPDGRVLGGRIPAQNLVVDRIGGS